MQCKDFEYLFFVRAMIAIDEGENSRQTLEDYFIKREPFTEYRIHYESCLDCKQKVDDYIENDVDERERAKFYNGLDAAIEIDNEDS